MLSFEIIECARLGDGRLPKTPSRLAACADCRRAVIVPASAPVNAIFVCMTCVARVEDDGERVAA